MRVGKHVCNIIHRTRRDMIFAKSLDYFIMRAFFYPVCNKIIKYVDIIYPINVSCKMGFCNKSFPTDGFSESHCKWLCAAGKSYIFTGLRILICPLGAASGRRLSCL